MCAWEGEGGRSAAAADLIRPDHRRDPISARPSKPLSIHTPLSTQRRQGVIRLAFAETMDALRFCHAAQMLYM